MMVSNKSFLIALLFFSPLCAICSAQNTAVESACPRPQAGSVVTEPADLRSVNGVLEVNLSLRSSAMPDGSTRYCYVDTAGNESPNLRVKPGDLVTINLTNDIADPHSSAAAANHLHKRARMRTHARATS